MSLDRRERKGLMKNFLIGGAGFSGAVLARCLAEAGHDCRIIEPRDHVAGNCHTVRDGASGVMVHVYGPHIFHTDDQEVWTFVNRHGRMRAYRHRVFARYRGEIYSLPINLRTINQFFRKSFSSDEARAYIAGLTIAPEGGRAPQSFEEQALAFVGRDLYEAFLKDYTLKQWGVAPDLLPASILKRLPLRFVDDDNYFFHSFQGIPEEGYTALVSSILDHPNIEVILGERISRASGLSAADHIFFTGPIDDWFNHDFGRLAYRTLDFDPLRASGDFQGCPVMNYSDEDIAWTRITEHKHFAFWESHDETICFKEFSRDCGVGDIPYYPVRLVKDKALLGVYLDKARGEKNVSFLGRLGTYRYLDMDVAIREAMDAARAVIRAMERSELVPSFFINQ